MKKFIRVILLGVFITLFMTGCSTTTQSPEKLLTKPSYDDEKAILSGGISKVLYQNVNLIFPENSSEVGKINYVDLDEDGNLEVIAFRKKENSSSSSEVGFMILREQGNNYEFIDDGVILEKGKKIEYRGFYDTNGDGKKEIIMQFKDEKGISRIKIYGFNDKYIKEILQINTKDSKSKDIMLKIGYLNEDNYIDIIMMSYNPDKKTMRMNLLSAQGDKLRLLDTQNYKDIRNIKEVKISVGNISNSKKGIIINIPNGNEGGVRTEMFYIKNDNLVKVSRSRDVRMNTSYYIPVSDINDDNIIDIPSIQWSSPIDKSYAYVEYLQWNGITGGASDFSTIGKIYYNYLYNFKFEVPESIWSALESSQRYDGDDIIIDFLINEKDGTPSKSAFVLKIKQKTTKLDDNNTINDDKGYISLMESGDYTYSISIKNSNLLKKYGINSRILKKSFSFAYE